MNKTMLRRVRQSLRPAARPTLADALTTVSRGDQLVLQEGWRRLVREGAPLPSFADVEFRAFSQTGEDGILLFALTVAGMTNRVCVEIGFGVPECNTANLILNHGFTGLLVDGDPLAVEQGRKFYAEQKDTRAWPPRLAHAFITRESVNELVARHGIEGEIDVFSIDIDGMDYWVWEALTAISPRFVMVEANNVWGPDESVAVPYSPAFRAEYINGTPDYSGASLLAYTRMARRKGYRLVGAQRYGFNALYARHDVAPELLPEVSVASCLGHPQAVQARTVRRPGIAGRELVAIGE